MYTFWKAVYVYKSRIWKFFEFKWEKKNVQSAICQNELEVIGYEQNPISCIPSCQYYKANVVVQGNKKYNL